MRTAHLLITGLFLLIAFLTTSGCGDRYTRHVLPTPSSEPYTISGTVKGIDNQPVGDVPILLSSTEPPHTFVVITLTNEDGRFQFIGLSDQAYTVTPKRNGLAFSPQGQSVNLNNSPSANLEFHARP